MGARGKLTAGFLAAFAELSERFPFKSETELCREIGIDRSEFSNVKNGRREATEKMILKFSKFSKMKPDQILAYAEKPLDKGIRNLKVELDEVRAELEILKSKMKDKEMLIESLQQINTYLKAENERLKQKPGLGRLA